MILADVIFVSFDNGRVNAQPGKSGAHTVPLTP